MSESVTQSGGSFSSAGDRSSIASGNTDCQALTALQSGHEEDGAGDVESNNQSVQEGVFTTIYLLSRNRVLDSSIRLAVLKVVLEFLQLFGVLFNPAWAWSIQQDLWIYKAVQWLLVRQLMLPKGYDTYVTFFYFQVALCLASILAAVWAALVLKVDDASNVWVKRLLSILQLFAMVLYTVFWVTFLDYAVFFFDCQWTNLAQGLPVNHIFFAEKSCLAMPHLAHMIFAGFVCVLFCGMTLMINLAYTDLNPMTRQWLAISDVKASFKILALKIIIVIVSTGMGCITRVQVVLVLLAVFGVFYYHFAELPYCTLYTNMAWTGLWGGLLGLSCTLLSLQFTLSQHTADPAYAARQTTAVLYTLLCPAAVAALLLWARVRYQVGRVSHQLHASFEQRKDMALAAGSGVSEKDRAAGASVVNMMGDLKGVYRYKDVRQVSVLCRDMRKWDEDGVPDAESVEYGELILKSGMARMPNNPALLVMYASFLIEVQKDGQAARTQLQLAQKANPSWLDNLNIFLTQQLAKQLKRDGSTLDLLGYVEYQRNYRSCVRMHKLALMAQRAFWNSLLRSDKVAFRDIQRTLVQMEETEAQADATYKRVLERYPGNGKLMKVYGRFLEFVRNDPWSANKLYDEALKQGTTESLLSLARGMADGDLSAIGSINEKVDGLVIINAQGIIMMVNAAAVSMFGYGKGELEGKNVSVLMPQPFSSQHNTFLQRYTQSGEPHILGQTRQMVALHKDHAVFPVNLCATRLSGMGSDTLFMGVLRRLAPTTIDGNNVVKFWVTANGLVLCADASVVNTFGLSASELVGQSFAHLCTDVEGVNRFIAGGDPSEAADGTRGQNLQTQMLHTYLPAIDVELSIQSGGSLEKGSEYQFFIIEARMVSESQATMAIDYRGRVVYATEKLSVMLGYPGSALVKMDMNNLMPPPYSQMHGAWFRDLSRIPHPTSCRAGGVVQLLAANGTQVSVTLKMSKKESSNNEHPLHIVQVTKSDESVRLGQQRLLLDVNHTGTILQVNNGAPNSLFGFNSSGLVGVPLAAIIDVFGLWRHKYGEDASLLAVLAHQALKHSHVAAAAGSRAMSAPWRVGIHQPVKDDNQIAQHAAKLAKDEMDNKGSKGPSACSLLQVLQQRSKITPACMIVEVLHHDQINLDDAAVAETTPVIQVSLYRSDALTAIIELDNNLGIARADQFAGLMLGCDAKQLLKRSFPKLMDMPASTVFDDLLGNKANTSAKKGAMKTADGVAVSSRVGVAKRLAGQHFGDGKPLTLEMQALSYAQAGKTRMLVRLQMQEPSSASMSALVQLKESTGPADAAPGAKLALADAAGVHIGVASDVGHGSHSSEESQGQGAQRPPLGKAAADMDSFNRTSHWVRENSTLPPSPTHQPSHSPPDGKQAAHKRTSKHQQQDADEEATVHVSARHGSRHAAPSRGATRGDRSQAVKGRVTRSSTRKEDLDHGDGSGSDGESLDDWGDERKGSSKAGASAPASIAESASAGGGASIGDAASEGGGGSLSNAGEAHDEDLAVDTRRAKRLKKLNRMVHSSVAQLAITTWKSRTLALLAAVLVAHVVCFVVLTLQVNSRYKDAEDVAHMAKSMDRFQLVVLRCQVIEKCWMDEYRNITACSDASMKINMNKLQENINLAEAHHTVLYLGETKLQHFADPRLMNYWTYHMLPEQRYFNSLLLDDGTVVTNGVVMFNRSLWEMGNLMLVTAKDVHFKAPTLTKNLKDYSSFQYVMLNGPASLFNGYAWSLDTFVDYAWNDLLKLSNALVALLVVEAVVLLSCMAYEFYLLQQCNVSHMRMFSVFLALPSATIRFLAQRLIQVDDDTKDDIEDEDVELLAGPTAAGDETAVEAEEAEGEKSTVTEKKKSVRVLVQDVSSDDEAGSPRANPNTSKLNRSASEDKQGNSSGKAKGKSAKSNSQKKPSLTGFALFKRNAYRLLLGWMDPKFKRNGKTLIADSRVVIKFMVPLLMWMSVMVAIFGVSYSNLQGLQGPLASLDTGAHVLYRMSRTRLMSGMVAFSKSAAEMSDWRAQLKTEIAYFREEYATLLYGGRMMLQANVSFDPVAPASAFSDGAIAELFFKTKKCIRWDQSQCITSPTDPYYDITHNGLDALVNRYLDEMTTFSLLPDDQAIPDHPAFAWALKLAGNDLYEGMQTACDLFVTGTLAKFEGVKMLHIILLVISLACMVLFLVLLYRPYIKMLHQDSKALAGMLSQLPAEVDVEGHVKAIVLGAGKTPPPTAIGQSTMAMSAQGFPGMNMSAGMMNQGGLMMLPAGALGMPQNYALPGAAYGMGSVGQGGAWLSQRRAANAFGGDANAGYERNESSY